MEYKRHKFTDPTGEFEDSFLDLPANLEPSPVIAVYTPDRDVIYLDRDGEM